MAKPLLRRRRLWDSRGEEAAAPVARINVTGGQSSSALVAPRRLHYACVVLTRSQEVCFVAPKSIVGCSGQAFRRRRGPCARASCEDEFGCPPARARYAPRHDDVGRPSRYLAGRRMREGIGKAHLSEANGHLEIRHRKRSRTVARRDGWCASGARNKKKNHYTSAVRVGRPRVQNDGGGGGARHSSPFPPQMGRSDRARGVDDQAGRQKNPPVAPPVCPTTGPASTSQPSQPRGRKAARSVFFRQGGVGVASSLLWLGAWRGASRLVR